MIICYSCGAIHDGHKICTKLCFLINENGFMESNVSMKTSFMDSKGSMKTSFMDSKLHCLDELKPIVTKMFLNEMFIFNLHLFCTVLIINIFLKKI